MPAAMDGDTLEGRGRPKMVRPSAAASGDVPIKTGQVRTLGMKVKSAGNAFYFVASSSEFGRRYARKFPLTDAGWAQAWSAFAAEDPVAAAAYYPALQVSSTPPPTTPLAASPSTPRVVPPSGKPAGGAKFVGDTLVGGISITRILNAGCYVITGVALLILSTQVGPSSILGVLGGLAALAYAAKILLTRTSYWMSSGVYLIPFLAVLALIGVLFH